MKMRLWEGGGRDGSFSRYRIKYRLGCSSQQIAVLQSWRWLNPLLNLEGRATGLRIDPEAQRTGSADIQESQLRTGPCDCFEHLLGRCAAGGPIERSYQAGAGLPGSEHPAWQSCCRLQPNAPIDSSSTDVFI